MKKYLLSATAAIVFALVGLSSVPAAAQSPSEATAKSNGDLASEIAALRKRIHRLELEQLDSKLHDRVRRLESEKSARTAPADVHAAAELSPPVTGQSRTEFSTPVDPALALGYAAASSRGYKATPQAVPGGGFYAWIDGLYDRLHLPAYAAGGAHTTDIADVTDLGSSQSFDPRQNTGGVRGAIGYAVPGSGFKFEVGGSYTAGSGSLQNTAAIPTMRGAAVLLSGDVPLGGQACPCAVDGTLRTSYDAWKVFAEAKYDAWKFGPLTLTATAAVFGGTSGANQDLTQTLNEGGTPVTYSSHTSLRWTDAGGRLGLDGNYAINPLLSVGLKGWAGLAGRDTSLSGNDLASLPGLGLGGSSITSSDTKAVFLANLEASFTHSLTSTLSVRGFAGFNYDNKVPGISSQTFCAPAGACPIQAGVSYASELDYYAGVGMNVKFGNIEYVR